LLEVKKLQEFILFINENGGADERRLQKAVESVVSEEKLVVFHKMHSFEERLRQLPRNIAVLVIYSVDEMQLSKLLSLKQYLEGLFIILVLQDLEKNTISKALKLGPKFFTGIKNDFLDIKAVLNKRQKVI
jgi:hypothetical protein